MSPAVLIPPGRSSANRRLVAKLMLIVAMSFAFGFALVPLYDVFCRVTGFGGKSAGLGGTARAVTSLPVSRVDTGRVVTVEFTATVMPGLAWSVAPLTTRLDLHPGEVHQALYRVRNLSGQTLVAQAVPSISPGLATLSFEKFECFCFTRQSLAAGEVRDLPLTFVVKPELSRDVRTLTLSYSFFNVAADRLAAASPGANVGTP